MKEENKGKPNPAPESNAKYVLSINNIDYKTDQRTVTLEQILAIGGISPSENDLFMLVKHGNQTTEQKIEEGQVIDLKEGGKEEFITRPKVIVYKFKIGATEYTTTEKNLTVEVLLTQYAQVDPKLKTLAKAVDGGFLEYKDLTESISMEGYPHFTLFDNDPLGVS